MTLQFGIDSCSSRMSLRVNPFFQPPFTDVVGNTRPSELEESHSMAPSSECVRQLFDDDDIDALVCVVHAPGLTELTVR